MSSGTSMVISVMDKDRPGIVAEITEGISSLGGNLADLRESVLCGYFTMILVADFPSDLSEEQVRSALAEATSSNISVARHAGEMVESNPSEHAYVLSAVGQDRVGLVAQVSRFCCEHGINILDLASHVEADQYTMMLQVDLEKAPSMEQFNDELAAFAASSGLNIALQHNDIFRATNEI